jgi:hypothetical protein
LGYTVRLCHHHIPENQPQKIASIGSGVKKLELLYAVGQLRNGVATIGNIVRFLWVQMYPVYI